MTFASRTKVVSSNSAIRGALIDETYAVFAAWDFARSKRDNLIRLREENLIGAKSASWLQKVANTLGRRFDTEGRDRDLVVLAKNGCELEIWKPLLLWHMTRDEFLLRDFLINWLFLAYEAGVYRVRSNDLHHHLKTLSKRGGRTERAWSEATLKRVAAGLLKMSVDFGLLHGKVIKEFVSYHLPERSFIYLLHAMRGEKLNPRKVIGSIDWRMFLMRPVDVEHELLRLHQFRKLDYQVAGSLVELKLPCESSREYAERMVA